MAVGGYEMETVYEEDADHLWRGEVRRIIRQIAHYPGNREEPPDTHEQVVLEVTQQDGEQVREWATPIEGDLCRPLALEALAGWKRHYTTDPDARMLIDIALHVLGRVPPVDVATGSEPF